MRDVKGGEHVPSDELTPHIRTKATRMDPAKKYNLQKFYLQPIPSLPEKTVASWCGYRKTKQHPARSAQYVLNADPSYNTKIQQAITQDAIGWNENSELMFVFRKGVIPQDVQDEALEGLKQLNFVTCNQSGRPELLGAVNFNGPNATVPAEELNMGYGEMARIFRFKETAPQFEAYRKTFNLLHHMTGVYATTLPDHFRVQNSNVPAKGSPSSATRVGIPADFRQGLSAFSSVALLKSAPSAVHKDAKNGNNFACMTSVAPNPPTYQGGTFCFVKYGVTVAVRPGDILIASTPRDWHANLTPVQGLKYSVVAYYKKTLHSPRLLEQYRWSKFDMAAYKREHGLTAGFPLADFHPDVESL
jgi:hypothetical protein